MGVINIKEKDAGFVELSWYRLICTESFSFLCVQGLTESHTNESSVCVKLWRNLGNQSFRAQKEAVKCVESVEAARREANSRRRGEREREHVTSDYEHVRTLETRESV